jgi:GBF-interacting protein 1 N-terminal
MAAVTVLPYLAATSLALHMSPCLQAKPTNKSVVELVKEATGASEEDVKHTLEECDYDVNKATNMLIDGATLPGASSMLCCEFKQPRSRACSSSLLDCIIGMGNRVTTCAVVKTDLLKGISAKDVLLLVLQAASSLRSSTKGKRRSR